MIFLDYIYNDKKKIAYASSFGREYWTGNDMETQEVSFYLKEFDHISVREKSGVLICKDSFHVDAEWVLDPVFLCDKKNYITLSEKVKPVANEEYIGGYILDIDDYKIKILEEMQDQLGMKCHLLTDAFREIQTKIDTVDFQRGVCCEEWLNNIINSKVVITDSFHGMCFAIIFQKPFVAICNKERGSVRFIDLLSRLGLMDRLITEQEKLDNILEIFHQDIDYVSVNNIIEKEKIRSQQWLCNALKIPKKYQLTKYDILIRKIQNAESEANKMEKKLPYIESELGNRKWDISVHRKELDEHKKLLGERLWDSEGHRKELDQHREFLDHIIQMENNLEKRIDTLERIWFVRIWRKISRKLHDK